MAAAVSQAWRLPATAPAPAKSGTWQLPAASPKTFWPTNYRTITQIFGALGPSGKPHTGLDIKAPQGSAVYAPVSGTVVRTTPMDPWGWGNAIEIATPQGIHLFFAHLSGFLVRPGQQVVGGQEIGLAGNTYSGTGYSTSAHLHFEVRDSSGHLIDPNSFLSAGSVTPAISTRAEPAGETIEASQAQQAMGASPAQLVNASSAPAAPVLDSPSQSALTFASSAISAAATSVAKPALKSVSAAPASSSTSGETVFFEWDLVNSPILGKVAFKLTPKVVAFTLGSLLIVIGLFLTGFPIWKKNIDESSGIVLDALKSLAKEAPQAAGAAAG